MIANKYFKNIFLLYLKQIKVKKVIVVIMRVLALSESTNLSDLLIKNDMPFYSRFYM